MQAISEINQQTGSSMDPNVDANSLMQQTTQGLMAAVSRLPQLLERKRTIEKHTNMLHNLLKVEQLSLAQASAWLYGRALPFSNSLKAGSRAVIAWVSAMENQVLQL